MTWRWDECTLGENDRSLNCLGNIIQSLKKPAVPSWPHRWQGEDLTSLKICQRNKINCLFLKIKVFTLEDF